MTIVGARTRIRREGVYLLLVAVFVLAGAWIHQISLLFVVAGMMLGPLLFSWPYVVAVLRGLEVERKGPAAINAGDLLIVRLSVRNTRRRLCSRGITVADRLMRQQGEPPPLEPHQPVATSMVLIPSVNPGSSVTNSYQGVAPERGVYRFGPLKFSTRFPLGLIRRTIEVDEPQTLVVYPRLGRLTPQWRKLLETSHAGQRRFHPRQSSSEADFYAMRDWRMGDSDRWIHWPTSARRGSLVVRQFEQKQHSDLVMLADLWLPPTPTPADRQRLETAIRFLATAAAELCRSGGDRLYLAVAGRQAWWISGVASSGMLSEILHRLAIVEGGDGGRIGEAAAGLSTAPPGRTALLVSTRRFDPETLSASGANGNGNHRTVRKWIVLEAGGGLMSEYFQTEDVFAPRPDFIDA